MGHEDLIDDLREEISNLRGILRRQSARIKKLEEDTPTDRMWGDIKVLKDRVGFPNANFGEFEQITEHLINEEVRRNVWLLFKALSMEEKHTHLKWELGGRIQKISYPDDVGDVDPELDSPPGA